MTSPGQGLRFLAEWSRDRSDWGVLDPDVKDAVELVTRQRARAEFADRFDLASLVSFVVGFVLGIASLFIWQSSLPLGIALGAVAALGFTASAVATFVSTRATKATLRTYREWIKSGDAILLSELDDFAMDVSLDDATLYRAASLVRDAKVADRRIAWAREALPEGRLAAGAHLTFADVDAAAIAMYQTAADLLDPNGEITNAWLRERVSA